MFTKVTVVKIVH